MTTLTNGYRSLSLLFNLNWDRLLFITAIFAALMAGAYLTTII